jgi:hypothetical protein
VPAISIASLRIPLSLVLAGCLTACLTGPESDPQASPTSQAPVAGAFEHGRPVSFRVALPGSAIGRVDSAELRVKGPQGEEMNCPLTVGDSALEAEVAGLNSGPAKLEVFAFADGALAYYGSSTWDPTDVGHVEFAVTLGRVGTVRIEGHFAEGME